MKPYSLDGRAKPRTSDQSDERTKRIRAAPTMGVVCITSATDSRELARSGGGALRSVSSIGGVNSSHEPSTKSRSLSRLQGVPITAVSPWYVMALSHGGASAAQKLVRSGTVAAVGLFRHLRPHFGRACRCLGSLGSFRTACRGHQMRSRQSASPSRRLAGGSKHVAQSHVGRARGLNRIFG